MPSTTPAEDNKLHGLSPAARNEGPENHKDNSKRMDKIHSDTTNKEDEKKAEKEKDDKNDDNA